MLDLRRLGRPHALAAGGLLLAVTLTACGGDGTDPSAEDPAASSASPSKAPSPSATSTPTRTPSPSATRTPSPSVTKSATKIPTKSPAKSPTRSAPAADPDAPGCADVWVTGQLIPRGYAGCNAGGAFVEPDVLGCSSGQRFVTFDDRWYGVLGGTVREAESSLEQDREYRASVASCRA